MRNKRATTCERIENKETREESDAKATITTAQGFPARNRHGREFWTN